MPQPKVHEYKSDIVLGEKYRDEQTGTEGIATAIYFFQHACERVMLEHFNKLKGEIAENTFDAPRLVHIETNKQATSPKTGGPERGVGMRPSGSHTLMLSITAKIECNDGTSALIDFAGNEVIAGTVLGTVMRDRTVLESVFYEMTEGCRPFVMPKLVGIRKITVEWSDDSEGT